MTDGQSEAAEYIDTSENLCAECETPIKSGSLCDMCDLVRQDRELIKRFHNRLQHGIPLTFSEQVELFNAAYPHRRIVKRKRCETCEGEGTRLKLHKGISFGVSEPCGSCNGKGYTEEKQDDD